MTLRAFEGFDHISNMTDLFSGVMTSAAASSASSFGVTSAVQFSGKCLQVGTSDPSGNPSAAYAARSFVEPTSTIVIGVSLGLSPIANTGFDIGITNGISCQVFCRFVLNQLFVYRGDPVAGGYVLLGSANTGLPSNGWGYVEIQTTIASSGSVSVYVNSALVLSLTSVNTSNDGTGFIGGVALGAYDGAGNGCKALFDDLYVLDLLGGAPNNTLLGPIRVIMKLPTANGSVGFTPLANANWQEVAETSFDADTSYNFSTVAGTTDLYPGTGLPATTTEVFAVQVKAAVRRDDAGSRMMSTVLSSGGTQVSGNTNALSPNYQYLIDIYSIDPHTGTTWTNAAVNASSFGYTVIS